MATSNAVPRGHQSDTRVLLLWLFSYAARRWGALLAVLATLLMTIGL
jgi:hypothetical protein